MRGIAEGWRRFWFEPQPTSTLGVVRIAFGIVVLGWTVSLAPDLTTFFGRSGLVPSQPSVQWWFDPLNTFRGDAPLFALYAVLLVGAICLLIGFYSRIASIIVFLGILTLERRNPYIFNSGDLLVRNLAFYLMLAPTGLALSLDRWREAKDRFWEFPARAPWGLRLIQVQLAVTYAATVWAKVQGTTWNNGTAVSFALRLEDLQRFHVPGFITHSIVASNLMTLGTLALEASLAVLVWNRKARPYVLALGALMHIAIAINIMVGFFTMAILTAYLAFIPPDTMARVIERARRRLGRTAEINPVDASRVATSKST
ncbi:MAG TPA: HTTM domain-containing protein [Actinomycetota bacterium]|nr:HTTM domain-containing protein [Actinomycetota bacterium]